MGKPTFDVLANAYCAANFGSALLNIVTPNEYPRQLLHNDGEFPPSMWNETTILETLRPKRWSSELYFHVCDR